MIRIEITFAVALYISLSIFLVIILWIFYNCTKKEQTLMSDATHLEQCRYCAHVFFNYLDKEIVVCPLCKSYIETNTGRQAPEKGEPHVKTAG
jgi:hypothetical protein